MGRNLRTTKKTKTKTELTYGSNPIVAVSRISKNMKPSKYIHNQCK